MCFCGLDFVGEALDEVFVDDSVGDSEEGDEMTLIVVELIRWKTGRIDSFKEDLHLQTSTSPTS